MLRRFTNGRFLCSVPCDLCDARYCTYMMEHSDHHMTPGRPLDTIFVCDECTQHEAYLRHKTVVIQASPFVTCRVTSPSFILHDPFAVERLRSLGSSPLSDMREHMPGYAAAPSRAVDAAPDETSSESSSQNTSDADTERSLTLSRRQRKRLRDMCKSDFY